MTYKRALTRLPWCALLLLCACGAPVDSTQLPTPDSDSPLGSAGAPASEPAIGVVSEALMQNNLTRTVPIDFYIMAPSGKTNAVNSAAIDAAIAFANPIYDGVVRFTRGQTRIVTTTVLHDACDYNSKGACLANQTNRTWAQIKADAALLGLPANAFPDTHSTNLYEWRRQIAAKMPWNTIPVLVSYQGNRGQCGSPFPHNDGRTFGGEPSGAGWASDYSHGISCTNTLGPLAHELGHYFALYHAWDMSEGGLAIAGQVPWDYYDLVYGPGFGPVMFTSRAAAKDFYDSFGVLLPKIADQGASNCGANACSADGKCVHTCTMQNMFGQTYTYTSSANPNEMYGVTFPVGSGAYAINALSYLCSTCPFRISNSQRDVIRSYLSSPQGQRHLLGEAVTYGPSVSSKTVDSIDVFWRNPDGGLVRRRHSGTWGTPSVLTKNSDWNTRMGSEPASDSWSDNHSDVLWRGYDNKLHHRTASGWDNDEVLASDVYSSPAVTSWEPGRLDVFWRGSDSKIKHMWFVNGGWSGVEAMDYVLTSDPVVTSSGPGKLDLLWRGSDGKIRLKSYDSTVGWNSVLNLGVWTSGAPTAAAASSGRLHIFWRDEAGELLYGERSLNPNQWVGTTRRLGNKLDSDPAAYARGERLDVFWARGGQLKQLYRKPGSDFSVEQSLGAMN